MIFLDNVSFTKCSFWEHACRKVPEFGMDSFLIIFMYSIPSIRNSCICFRNVN